MKLFIKKIYIIFFLLTIFFAESKVFARENNTQYSKKDISNYFSGIISISKEYNNDKAFKYLDDVQSIHSIHSQYNIEYLRTLVLLEKFRRAFAFSKKVWSEDELFFEADLLLGLNFFIKKDYKNAEKYFKRLNKISHYNLIFDNFVGNILLAWTKASQGHEAESYQYIKKIPNLYNHLKETQNIFLQCYFDNSETQKSLEKLIGNKDYNFSRYNFFLINYLLSQNKTMEAKEVIKNSRKKHNSNLLIKQTEYFFLSGENEKIINFFNCKNPKDSLAEFFYVIANLYSSEQDYRLSNFYLQISFFLNNNFLSNKALLAENFYFQNKKKEAKKVYKSIKTIGSVYSWHSSKNIATILQDEEGIKYSINSIQKDFNLLLNTNFEHYYELANFYKENDYYEESIKYYSMALNKIKENHYLVPKILDRRGTSYERSGDWEKAEIDLMESLKISPEQPYVLNYLAYSWVEKEINIDKALDMLKKAVQLKKNDPYIIDSLGWAYYARKNYAEAKKFLQKAVALKPLDPVINDHYADSLWMLNKNIQAKYTWEYALSLDGLEEDRREKINNKLIFGIKNNL